MGLNEQLIKNLSNLPALNTTIIEVAKIKDDLDIGISNIINIIKKDPMETMNLLKAANKPFYQRGNEIKTLQQAVILFGITKTFGILLDNNIRKLLSVDLKPYNISPDYFGHLSYLQSSLAEQWYSHDKNKSESLFLAALVQEVGKIVISNIILEEGEESNFAFDISTTNNPEEIEEAYLGFSTIAVTSKILNHWNIHPDTTLLVEKSVNPMILGEKERELPAALQVIRTIIPINKPLSETSIAYGLKKAENYKLDVEKLKSAIKFIMPFKNIVN